MQPFEKTGVLSKQDLHLPTAYHLKKGVAILECIQEIPCNPCVEACPVHAISMKDINAPPVNDYDTCIGCGKCIGVCPGLAIFMVKITNSKAQVTLPYEFLPVPEVGDEVQALDREGIVRDTAVVQKVLRKGKTMVITIEVKKELAMDIRNIRVNV
jgi:Fe-S-cluster-containing hydrogenase component 2